MGRRGGYSIAGGARRLVLVSTGFLVASVHSAHLQEFVGALAKVKSSPIIVTRRNVTHQRHEFA